MDLDEILDKALEDFEKDNINKRSKNILNKSTTANATKSKINNQSTYERNEELPVGTQQMLNGFNDPRFNDTLATTLKSLSQTKQGGETIDNLFQNIATPYNKANYKDYQLNSSSISQLNAYSSSSSNSSSSSSSSTAPMTGIGAIPIDFNNTNSNQLVEGTLKALAEAQRGMEGFEAGAIQDTGEEMMNDMMKQFEELGR